MDIEIRPIQEDEFEAYGRALAASFGEPFSEQDMQRERGIFEFDRSLAAFDGPRIVGTTAAYSLELTVPGGLVPMAGVTAVGVVPTHRRRGILTALKRRQLEDFRERGELLAGLWATEGSIYGRFGYGSAVLAAGFEIERQFTAFPPRLEAGGSVELVTKEEALEAMPGVYERIRRGRPGMVGRHGEWWQHVFHDDERWRDGASEYFFVLRRSAAGDLDGYVAYRLKREWDERGPKGELRVREMTAATPEAYEALWRYCFGVDLVSRVTAWNRPADEPLLFMIADLQRLGLRLGDSLWLRLVDVPRALASRGYSVEGAISLQVRDGFCPWNEGTYRLEVSEGRAECRPTSAAPDLVLGAVDLGAAFLGGVRFSSLAEAGRVTEEVPGALRRADSMFLAEMTPWCPNPF